MIPAKVYLTIVGQWAMARGLKFWTWHDQKKAMAHYEIFAAWRN
jgi:hypothetical protein